MSLTVFGLLRFTTRRQHKHDWISTKKYNMGKASSRTDVRATKRFNMLYGGHTVPSFACLPVCLCSACTRIFDGIRLRVCLLVFRTVHMLSYCIGFREIVALALALASVYWVTASGPAIDSRGYIYLFANCVFGWLCYMGIEPKAFFIYYSVCGFHWIWRRWRHCDDSDKENSDGNQICRKHFLLHTRIWQQNKYIW